MRNFSRLILTVTLVPLLAPAASDRTCPNTEILTITNSYVDPVPIYTTPDSAQEKGGLPQHVITSEKCGIRVEEITPANMMRIAHDRYDGWVNPMFLETNFPIEDVPACNLIIGSTHTAGTRGISKSCNGEN